MKNQIVSKKNKTIIPKKATRNNFEKRFLAQKDEIKIRDGQLKQGVDREKKGADREKLAEEQIYIQAKAMESTLDSIFIIDAKKPNFIIIYANQAFQALTGYAKKEIIGQNYFLLLEADIHLTVIDEIKQTMIRGDSFHGEMINLRKNGKKFWSSLRIAPVRGIDGDITHYVGTQTDITLVKARDLEIEEQREQLLHVTRVGKLAEFVSSLAHEISQPLTAILAYAQAAQRLLKDRESSVQEILQFIVNDDQRAAEVIRRLRYLLKKSKSVFEDLELNTIIKDTVTLIMPDIISRDKGIKLELNLNLPLIQGDRIQLQQVMLNLISNSLEAMEASRDSYELKIKTSLKGNDSILVEIIDSGSGISKDNLSKIFTHFFTNKPDGLGMGLSISRSIIEAHGGKLEGKNNPGRGANFHFTIPIRKKNADE